MQQQRRGGWASRLGRLHCLGSAPEALHRVLGTRALPTPQLSTSYAPPHPALLCSTPWRPTQSHPCPRVQALRPLGATCQCPGHTHALVGLQRPSSHNRGGGACSEPPARGTWKSMQGSGRCLPSPGSHQGASQSHGASAEQPRLTRVLTTPNSKPPPVSI